MRFPRLSVDHSPGGCWTWTGRTDAQGYGRAEINDETWLAHRLSYSFFVGKIPPGVVLDHTCRNTSCVNPWHLEEVTPVENTRRGAGQVAYCKNNHPLIGDNLRYRKDTGTRVCRACVREASRRRRLNLR